MNVFRFDPQWQRDVNRRVWRSIVVYSVIAVIATAVGFIAHSWVGYAIAAYAAFTSATNYFSFPKRKELIESHYVEVTDTALLIAYKGITPEPVTWKEIEEIKEKEDNGSISAITLKTRGSLGKVTLEGLLGMEQLAKLIRERARHEA